MKKMIRSATDICLLCQVNKADKKGSHYTPAGIIKKVIGERDYEELYSLNNTELTQDVFFGRSNLQNTSPLIKKPSHVKDYIFCSECEKKLGLIESECNHRLNGFVEELTKGNRPINTTLQRNKYISFKKPHQNVLSTYFYSIIWRQSLDQYISNGSVIINAKFQELLRQVVHNEIYKPIKDIEASPDFPTYPSLIIYTTYHKGDLTRNFINPNPSPSNPELFFVGIYDALIFHSQYVSQGFASNTGLPTSFIDKELILNTATEGKVGVMNEGAWDKKIKRLAEHEATKHNHNFTFKLVNATGYPYPVAKTMLVQRTKYYENRFPNDYVACLNQAFNDIVNDRWKKR